jgi:hypothetical protein
MELTPSLRQWLLHESDPSLVYRLLTEVDGRTPDDPEVVAARSRVGAGGWAQRILSEQLASGAWASPTADSRGLYVPKYIATNWRLLVLSDMGLTRERPEIERAVQLVFAAHDRPDGDLGGTGSEVCFTGNAVRYLSRVGYGNEGPVRRSIDWLVATQKPDGGWHCDVSEGGTLDCWEALAAFASLPPAQRSAGVEASIRRGAEFYLERGLLREGPIPYPPWSRLHYPNHYYYDVLVGLDTLTRLGYGRDPRLGPALDLLESKRDPQGRWSLESNHPDLDEGADYSVRTPYYPLVLEPPGPPSRWITITALAVLRRAGRLTPTEAH